jgi:hypothetical protein
MTTSTKELIDRLSKISRVETDLYYLTAQRLRELDKLVKAVHSAKGRHHSQIAMCDLYEASGLPFQRPNCGGAVKESK